jgi:DNA (cytosine-5)-methyltransferase 1
VNVIDLFSGGAGGWTLGLHRAGFRTVAACEVDPDRRAAYSANFPSVKVYDDVRTLTADRLRADGIGAIEVVAGSPPCQDISEANATGKGIDGERSGLFWEYLRLVQELRPRWALAENVPRFRSRGYDRLHDAMEAAGYTPRPLVVGAWLLGAPHKRDRVWIVANAAGIAGRPGASRQDRAEAGERPSAFCAYPTSGGREAEGWGRREDDVLRRDDSPAASDANGHRQLERAFDGEMAWILEHPWAGGIASHLRMADGVPAGVARFCRAAYGDAVVPQITEAIGRSIMRIEHAFQQ